MQDDITADDWIESFKNWANKERHLLGISDEMLSRENIYEDRL